MMSLTDKDDFQAVVAAALRKDMPLSLEMLQKITNSGTTLQDIINMLCVFINANDKASAGEVQNLCDLILSNQQLQERLNVLTDQYNKLLTNMLEVRQHESELILQKADMHMERATLQAKIKDLESRLNTMSLLR